MAHGSIYVYVLSLLIHWCNGTGNESSALSKCKFSKYLAFNTSQASLCEREVNEFLTEFEKCEEAIDLETKGIKFFFSLLFTQFKSSNFGNKHHSGKVQMNWNSI